MEINGNCIICFLDWRLLIAPLVSSTCSFQHRDINESWKSGWLLFNSKMSNMSAISWRDVDALWWYDNDILLHVVCLAGKQHIPILSYLVGSDQGSNPQSIPFEVEHANNYTLLRSKARRTFMYCVHDYC